MVSPVCYHDNSERCGRISMIFFGGGCVIISNWLDYGGEKEQNFVTLKYPNPLARYVTAGRCEIEHVTAHSSYKR